MKPEITSFFKYLLLAFLIINLWSCAENIQIEDVRSGPDPNNQLIHNVQFTANIACEAYVEYWNSSDSIRYYSVLSGESTQHDIPIINLQEEQEYHFQVHLRSGELVSITEPGTFTTGSLPDYIPAFKLYEDDYRFPGYILIKTFHKSGSLIILNSTGKVVWYYPYEKPVVRPFNITDQDHIVSLVDSSYIEEIDLYGNVINTIYTKDFGVNKLHHELIKRDNRIIGLTYEQKYLDLSDLGGIKNDTITGDGIVVFDLSGNIQFQWSVFDILGPLTDKNIMEFKEDWGHANSINIDFDGHYIISFRDFSQIWKINSYNGELIWKLGIEGDFDMAIEDMPLRQHTVHRDIFNNLLMFDNGSDKRGFSRILSLRFHDESNTWEKVLDLKLNKELTTFRMGSAYFIDNEHILVCSPKKLLNISILDTTGEITWRLFSTLDSYRAIYLQPEFIENESWF